MEGLRPDRDELDQFQKRQHKSKVSAKPGVSKKTNAPMSAQDRVSSPVTKPNNKSSSSTVFVVLLLCVCAGMGWMYWQQQVELVELRKELTDASGFIGQSKLLMARLEGELSETGAELEQSGSAAQKKLAFLDSEMRKLWGVSNDRNKKLILKNEESLATLNARVDNLGKRQDSSTSSHKAQIMKVEESFQAFNENANKRVGSIDKRVSALASEVAITREEQEGLIDNMQVSLGRSDKNEKARDAIEKQVDSNKKSIASIDTSRLQLNERILELDRKLNELQLISSQSASQKKKVSQ